MNRPEDEFRKLEPQLLTGRLQRAVVLVRKAAANSSWLDFRQTRILVAVSVDRLREQYGRRFLALSCGRITFGRVRWNPVGEQVRETTHC